MSSLGFHVTIGLSSDDTSEGTVSVASVVFTAANWNAPQTITVTGVDDDLADGNVAYSVVTSTATSSDLDYNGLDALDVQVTNNDDAADSAEVVINAPATLSIDENGGLASFTVVLNSMPLADVNLTASSSDPSEGLISNDGSIFTTLVSLNFNSSNWNVPQVITVQGQSDRAFDENVQFSIVLGVTSSDDTNYDGIDPDDVTVINGNVDAQVIPAINTYGFVILMLMVLMLSLKRKEQLM